MASTFANSTTMRSALLSMKRRRTSRRSCRFSISILRRIASEPIEVIGSGLRRESEFLRHPVFNRFHTETELLRYISRLESRDLSLTTSMIPLGSCTMKLNAAAEMFPVTWEKVAGIHPFVPVHQARGYQELFAQLERWLAEITGFAAVSLQPNAGSQGEYAGLLVIRAYHQSRGDKQGAIFVSFPPPRMAQIQRAQRWPGCRSSRLPAILLETSIVPILRKRSSAHRETLAALMITYPSTHGVFEESIEEICAKVHAAGGMVYMDGANMNAQVGLCRPADIGADVCHLNLHKTFCIPHGGGGPGVGPICVVQSSRAIPAGSLRRQHRRSAIYRRNLRGALGKREHSGDLVDVHRDDGRGWTCWKRQKWRS